MTHKCFKCDERFQTSGRMVQHMREAHSSFVENAQMKIDRSQESSFEAKRASEGYISTAKCPFCMIDCMTRKKLVQHLTVEHQDEDEQEEVEPELKIIRVENDSDRKLFGHLRDEQSNRTNKSSIVSDLLNVLETDEQKKEFAIPGASGTVQVSSTSIKLPEKRYRCFWCDASFRKRGKLMDHIDMFHKANKQQIEDEAELIVSATSQTPPVTENVPIRLHFPPQPKKVSAPATTVTKVQPAKVSGRRRTNSSKRSSRSSHVEAEPLETVINNVCQFLRSASITEVSRMKHVLKTRTSIRESSTNCKFFSSREPNPITPLDVTSTMSTSSTEGSFSPSQYTNLDASYSVPSTVFSESPYFQQDITRSTTDTDFCCAQTYYSLPKPQPIYPPSMDSAVRFYTRQMAMSANAVDEILPMGQNQHQPTTRPMDYQHQQHSLSLYGYQPYRHNPEIPLDLTVAKY